MFKKECFSADGSSKINTDLVPLRVVVLVVVLVVVWQYTAPDQTKRFYQFWERNARWI